MSDGGAVAAKCVLTEATGHQFPWLGSGTEIVVLVDHIPVLQDLIT